ncbi:hypothetical protein KT71_08535 [Congregibacter litoralis KT71]|uniref:Uncharacterized protein n=1 Tax=Congregibacter litoralis KT71 TaxID=314285 RepID=A4AD36_9GAMM|nr:hypothetical protein KT71_08535 [Congregibacter litoralis KT71]
MVEWENVVVKLCSKNRVEIFINERQLGTFELHQTELLDDRTKKLSKAGAVLLQLASKPRYSRRGGMKPTIADKNVISKLRIALKAFVGCSSDPFHPLSYANGWVAKFRVEDHLKG